jgi:hypothetical protein
MSWLSKHCFIICKDNATSECNLSKYLFTALSFPQLHIFTYYLHIVRVAETGLHVKKGLVNLGLFNLRVTKVTVGLKKDLED